MPSGLLRIRICSKVILNIACVRPGIPILTRTEAREWWNSKNMLDGTALNFSIRKYIKNKVFITSWENSDDLK